MSFLIWLFFFFAGASVISGVNFSESDLAEDSDAKAVEDYISTENWLKYVESELSIFNRLSALLTWELTTNPNDKAALQAMQLGVAKHRWKNRICELKPEAVTSIQKRKTYLLCRGPRFTSFLIRKYLEILGKMSLIYNAEICLPNSEPTPLQSLSYRDQNTSTYPSAGDCLRGEPDLERLMKRADLNIDQLLWVWRSWHNYVGPPMKDHFLNLVQVENAAAQNNGYPNMGEVWKEELEIDNLEELVFKLYEEIKPLYEMLHAVIRHKLLIKYGPMVVDPVGPIPIHILGNMWGQDWSTLIDLLVPPEDLIDLDGRLRSKNWTIYDMITQAEDLYMSLGLPGMTKQFWRNSAFEKNDNMSICHGSAADLYAPGDYRIIMCANIDMENFYVIHHELGHIQYFMAYENQSSLFQDGASSAIHESIGDAVMNTALSPQHLHRLGLITDEELFSNTFDQFLLLKQALNKLPEIPFALVMDKYRWDIFKGKIREENLNRVYWKLSEVIRGITAPEQRGEEYFDAAGKFHISDNTPYIRYFLSNILQMGIHKGLCEISLYGGYGPRATNHGGGERLPLHRCDIYGSKKCGKYLRAMMQEGASINWSEALKILTGKGEISTKPLLEYYRPISEWLENYIELYKIPVGW